MATSSSSSAVLQAHAELWNLTFSYLKSVALETAVSLGVLNAIYSLGDAATLQDLLAAVPLPEHRKPYFPRLMRFLAATGIVTLDVPAAPGGEGGGDGDEAAAAAAAGVYRLTPVSRLLVDDDDGHDGDVGVSMCARSLSPFVLMQVNKYHVVPSLHLSAWFKADAAADDDDDDGQLTMPAETTTTPFKMAYGVGIWDAMGRDAQFSEVFNAGLASDSWFVLDSVIATCGDDVFGGGITSLVDVGGGTGAAARAIARAFPHVACSVLDLPTVISGIRPPPASGDTVAYIAGDMMNSIPPADAVLLKYVLHDWNDEDCVKILAQCKKAICSGRQTGGKAIIIDVVVGSAASKIMFQTQVAIDLLMMVATGGKERDEHEWHKIFMEAGFKHYKIRPAVGFLSIIEVYP